jgi:predicted DNA-binding transcriptional regulator YafY
MRNETEIHDAKVAALLDPHSHGMVITVVYTNYNGQTSDRHILPLRIWFGQTQWHPTPQWLLEAVDIDKGATRNFALRDIKQFAPGPT